VELSIAGLGEGLKLLERQGANLVLIDTPPNSIHDMAGIFPLADLVLVPIKPTPDDLQAAAVTVASLKALRLPFLFVITQAIQNTNITAQAIAALSHHGPVAETLLVNRVVYPAAFTDGRTPQEIDKNGQAAREVGKLWVNIKACLHANMQEQRKAANG
jgi:chromosome partitioning protein